MVGKEGKYIKRKSCYECAVSMAKGKHFRLDRSVFLPYLKGAGSFRGWQGQMSLPL
jgi:hypothetical protein